MADTTDRRAELARRKQDLTNPLDKARSHRLLAVVKKEVGMSPTKEPSTIVHVWPHLLMIEFLCAIVFTITLFITSAVVNGPLDDLANAEVTPNPSKAPWYFLNLQELLLHMDAALAGVIIPTIALGVIAIIPFFDLGPGQMGRWFTSERGKAVVIFSSLYTFFLTTLLLAFDILFSTKKVIKSLFPVSSGENKGKGLFETIKVPIPGGDPAAGIIAPTDTPLDIVISNWIIPITAMLLLSALLVFLVKKRFGADTRDIWQALFTGFVVVYALTTVVGTAMRGPGQEFYWPWAIPPKH